MTITDQISGAGVSIVPANNVSIIDAGGYYTSSNVEGALQEIAPSIAVIPGKLDQVETLDDLRDKSVTETPIYVAGASVGTDLGGGMYFGVVGAPAGTYTDNGTTIIVPTGGNGSSAWVRISENYTSTVVNTIAELRTHTPGASVYMVNGYYTAGDGGGGLYYPAPTVVPANFTGSLQMTVNTYTGVDTVLTVSSVTSGTIYVGMKLTSAPLASPLYVNKYLGVVGGYDTYSVRDVMGRPVDVTAASATFVGKMYSDNGGTIIVPTGGDGTKAWKREISGEINAKWFGTKSSTAELSSVFASLAAAQAVYPFVTSLSQTVDWAALQAAILFAQGWTATQYGLFIPKGGYYTKDTLTINHYRGIKLRGEKTLGIDNDGTYISYSGGDYAIRMRNRSNVDVSVPNVTVTNGSAVVTGVTSYKYLTTGMPVTINGGSWGTISAINGTSITLSVTYTGSTSSTATFDAVFYNGDMYRADLSEFGIYCTNNAWSLGGIYVKALDEGFIRNVDVYGSSQFFPDTKIVTGYGFYLDVFSLSTIENCRLVRAYTGMFIKGQVLGSTIRNCNIFMNDTGIDLGGGIFGLNIEQNYFEYFESAIRLTNNSNFPFLDSWMTNIKDNSFSRSIGSGNSRVLNVQNADNSKLFRTKLNFEGNYCFMVGSGGINKTATVTNGSSNVTVNSASYLTIGQAVTIDGVSAGTISGISGTTVTLSGAYSGSTHSGAVFYAAFPSSTLYACQLYMDAANGFSSFQGHFHNNVFAGVTSAGISVNDGGLRPVIIEAGNITTSDWNDDYLPNFAFIQSSVSAITLSGSLYRSNQTVSAPANTNENVLATFVIPGNFLKFNGGIRIATHWTTTNNANAKDLYIKFTSTSGTTIATVNATSAASSILEANVFNRNSTTSQIAYGKSILSSGVSSCSTATATLDTKAPVTVVITAKKGTSGDTIALESVLVEAIPS